jgi:hypothetical protein
MKRFHPIHPIGVLSIIILAGACSSTSGASSPQSDVGDAGSEVNVGPHDGGTEATAKSSDAGSEVNVGPHDGGTEATAKSGVAELRTDYLPSIECGSATQLAVSVDFGAFRFLPCDSSVDTVQEVLLGTYAIGTQHILLYFLADSDNKPVDFEDLATVTMKSNPTFANTPALDTSDGVATVQFSWTINGGTDSASCTALNIATVSLEFFGRTGNGGVSAAPCSAFKMTSYITPTTNAHGIVMALDPDFHTRMSGAGSQNTTPVVVAKDGTVQVSFDITSAMLK